ncbi:hypothetical protein RhiirC2_790911 [Rhizophagus irregularis]|uniref:Integrase catalytic domain-containing protein n=1 Tax=Rhizophagus irregularis TaxID=588596 RepID=A0A2N1MKA0_9GLOM|nr:hypothetical protein RhiirC2_790911 [Rhizophagus irregularis]
MDKKGMHIRVGTTHKSQAIVERYNQTLAERLFKIQDAKELLTEGISPVEAIQKDQVYTLPSKISKDRLVGAEKIRLPAGSLVRYLLDSSDY